MTTSAARELAKAINQKIHKAFINGKTTNDELIEQSESLITQALKRCRNEALEEAARIQPGNLNITANLTPAPVWIKYMNAIRNLKESE